MLSPTDISMLAATVGSGLIAGLCFTFGAFVMKALDRLGAPHAIRAMQAINATILRSSAMAVWFGTAVAGVVAVMLAEECMLTSVAAASYAIGAILITGRGNVPLNDRLAHVDPDTQNAEETWRRYRVRWGRWNAARTGMLTFATAGFALAR
tara:strand:+ start:832 stop:1287 length:456 start_codon:yes stop_codon:yes gene_type:complete